MNLKPAAPTELLSPQTDIRSLLAGFYFENISSCNSCLICAAISIGLFRLIFWQQPAANSVFLDFQISIAAGGSSDQYYKGGSTGATQSAGYPNHRSGALFEYLLNLQNGDYVVQFAFVEPQFTSPGSRSFDVYIQNFKRISGYDIAAKGGSASNAVTVQRTVHVSNGLLRLKFQDAGSDAVVSGITVSPLPR